MEEHELHKKQLEKMDTDYKRALKETLKETERLDNEYQKSKQIMEKVKPHILTYRSENFELIKTTH